MKLSIIRRLLPALYKRDSNGNVRVWQMEVQGDRYRSITGVKDGKLIVGAWTLAQPTNVGRANALTAVQQASAEAQQHWEKQIRMNGYVEEEGTIDEEPEFREPMTANVYEDKATHVEKAFLKKSKVFIQPKLNGVRCNIGKKIGCRTRRGKFFVAVPHIVKELAPILERFPNLVLDGELYNHRLKERLNEMCSLVKKQKLKPEDIKKSAELVEFHVYDCYLTSKPEMSFEDRYEFLRELVKLRYKTPHLFIVPTFEVFMPLDIERYYKSFTDGGYEGGMIRIGDSLYQHDRTNDLLKYKPWVTEEFRIIEVVEGKGKRAGTAGAVWCKLNKPGKDGSTKFKANVSGGTEKKGMTYMKQLWDDRKSLVGKKATVEFAYYTEYGVPFHGYLITIRDYE